MKHLRTHSSLLLLTVSLSGCAHAPVWPKVDHSSHLDLTALAKQYHVPRCKVSVPLTPNEVLRAARLQGNPYTEQRTSWAAMVQAIQPGDQLRQVICLTTGPSGYAAGDVFYGLFRQGKMVAEMHTVIIN